MPKISEKCLKIARTLNLYLSFIGLGLCIAIPGPTLLDLQLAVGTDTKNIAFIYTSRSTGYLLGSLIGGFLFDWISNKQSLLIVLNLLMSVCTIVTPWSRSLITLIITMTAGGITMGALDPASNVFCLNIWGKDSGPFFQALHFAFGFGGFIAPLIAAPFLMDRDSEANVTSGLNSKVNVTSAMNSSSTFPTDFVVIDSDAHPNSSTLEQLSFNPDSSIPRITYAYSIIGGYAFFVTLLFLAVFIYAPKETVCDKDKEKTSKDPGRSFTAVVVLLTTILLFVYAGTEIGYAQMLTTYAVKGNLKLSKATGSFMTSVFWGTFSFSRGVSIFLAYKFSCLTLMIGDLILTVVAGVVLLALGVSSETCLWIGTAILGLGLASFFPSAISWVERYINVSNKIASTFVVGAAVGEMIIPLLISQFIDTVPEALFYVVMASGTLCCVVTLILWLIVKRKGEKYLTEEVKTTENSENSSVSRF